MGIGIGYSKEERQRIIRCCRQMLHQKSKLLGEALAQSRLAQSKIGNEPKEWPMIEDYNDGYT
jgi:hypothetical protein